MNTKQQATAGFLVAVILALALGIVVVGWQVANPTLYEDGSYNFVNPLTLEEHDGCFFVLGCLLADEVVPVDEEWLEWTEYEVGGPLVQDGTVVISGWNHEVETVVVWGTEYDATFWNCYHALNVCVLRHDDRPLFYRVFDFPPPGWDLLFNGDTEF